jgi:Rhs element Vgr protein
MPECTQQDSVLLRILVEGVDVSGKYQFISVNTNKTINKVSVARVVLQDGDPAEGKFKATDSDDFSIGSRIEIKAGYHDQAETIYKGIITKLSISAHGSQYSILTIECRDIAYRTTLRRYSSSFENTLDSDCISRILDKYEGLLKTIEPTTVMHEILLQQDISDWDFINLRAEANGKVVIVSDDELKVKKIDTTKTPKKTFIYGRDILSLDISMDSRSQILDSQSITWNTDSLENEEIDSTEIPEKSFGTTDYRKLAVSTKEEKFMLYHDGILATDEMKNLADAVVDFSRISKIQGQIIVEGLSDIALDDMIVIDKGAYRFAGKGYVSGVKHIIEGGGWQTELSLGLKSTRYMHKYPDLCSLPAAGVIAPFNGIHIGKVKKVYGDPKQMNRVFVSLSLIHKEDEGIWCRLASPYASEEVGMLFFPEIDSEVAVLFVNSDPRSPIIVGSLYGKRHRTPEEVGETNSKKAIVTKGKLKISFDDEDKVITVQVLGSEPRSITISDKDGSISLDNGTSGKIEIDSEGIKISTPKDIRISADGAIKMSAKTRIELESDGEADLKGQLVKITADSSASMEGSGSVAVRSAGEAVLRGAIVRIN